MSELQMTTVNGTTLKRKPVIKLSKAQKAKPGESELLSNLGLIKNIPIYESSNAHDPILGGQYKQLKLINYFNRVTNSSRTFANAVDVSGADVVKNSDLVTKTIGQKSYDLVFHALCSVLSNETKIKAMLALLTVPNKYKDGSTQTDNDDLRGSYGMNDVASQTDIMTPLNVLKKKRQFRNKKKLVPYVVPNEDVVESEKETNMFTPNKPSIQTPQRIIINPKNFKEFRSKELPVLEDIHKDLDQESDTNFSDVSIDTVSTAFERNVETHLSCIDQRTDKSIKSSRSVCEKLDEPSDIFNRYDCKLYDGSVVMLPTEPKTVFHIATRDNLAFLTPEEKRKVIHHQAFVDWKLCLQPNEDGNL
ncbi:hypothetical protein EVAR_47297_1 [Eumeta japonica]|uniref:Uncharacterized protein n=1 Tax=Eumeta variegata TaxID=151549 RepID=A0A4C1YFV8_EUMVA|nr:hypothetical protein EVAR_47297_1 [Eumeta japonica]